MTFARRIVIGVAAGTLVPLIFAALVYRNLATQSELREGVRARYEALTSAALLERLAIDMETGVRGFRVANGQEFLEPYRAAVAALPALMRQLRSSLASGDDRGQVEEIYAHIERWRAEWAGPRIAAIAASPAVGTAEAVMLLQLPPQLGASVGKASMDEIRRLFDRWNARQREGLAKELALQAQSEFRLSRLLWGVAVAFSLLMALGAAQLLGHLHRRMDALFSGIRAAENGDYGPLDLSGRDEPALVAEAFDRMLRQVEKRDAELSSIVENIPAMIFVKDAVDLRFVRVNRAGEQLLGIARADLLGKTDFDFFPRDQAESFTAKDREVLAGERLLEIPEEHLASRDGGLRVLHTKKIPIRDGGGKPRYLLGISEDITDTRRAEEEIRKLNAELERRLAELHAANRLTAFGVDVAAALARGEKLRDSLHECSEAVIRHLGAPMAGVWVLDEKDQVLELAGSAGFDATEEDCQTRIPVGTHRLGRIAEERRPQLVSLDPDTVPGDGEIWARRRGMISFAGYPLLAGGRLVGVLSVFAGHDLTNDAIDALASVAEKIALGIERAQAREALAANEDRTRAIIDNMLGGLITADAHGRIESSNPAAERMFRCGGGGLEGHHLSERIPFAEAQTPEGWVREATRKALGRVTEWKAVRCDGSRFDMELSLFPFATRDGWHFAANVADISERREVERMKKEFVSTVSHELRTPLTSIRGSLGLLTGGVLGQLPDEAKEILSVAERNVIRLVTLINDILDLERLDSGRLEMHFVLVPVSSVVDRAIESIQALAEQTGITIESTSKGGALYADPDRLVQVLVNLLSNAVKFSAAGSTIRLSVDESKDLTEIRVTDEGRGIPADLHVAIFERFRQVEATDAREKGGSGLGLAICKAIVEQHGGTIGVESEEGKGSSFWMRLPGAASPRAAVKPGVFSRSPRPGVLLVEDDPTLLTVISRQLGEAGLDVRSASSGRGALALADERLPDLLVLDLRLPDGDGFFVVEELRRHPHGLIPLIVYSERDVTARERDRLRLGPTRFMTKSRSTDREFLDAVGEMLSEPQTKGR